MTTATLRVVWATNADLASIPDGDLSPREIERASRYRSDLRRQQYTASRALLRALLAALGGWVSYLLFDHVQRRVSAWLSPLT